MAHPWGDEPSDGHPGAVSEGYRQGAEEVRAHLVCLRGGAPFLSPADALQLVQWFDRGVPVSEILRALERAHAARRRSGSRVPFGLSQARRHLGKPTTARPLLVAEPPAPEGGAPLAALAASIRVRAAGDAREGALLALAGDLRSIGPADRDDVVRAALACLRAFRDALWDGLSTNGRESARAEARAELAELLSELEPATAEALVEEEARERIRAPYAWLDGAAVWDAVEGA